MLQEKIWKFLNRLWKIMKVGGMTFKTWYSLDLLRILTTRSFLPTLQKTPGLCRDWGSSRGALGKKKSSSNQHFFRICEFTGGVFVFFSGHLMACDDMWFFAMQESGQSTLVHASVASMMDGFLIPRCAFLVYTLQKKERCILCIQNTVCDKQAMCICNSISHPSSLSLFVYICSRLRFEYLSDTFQVNSTQDSPKML